MRPAETAVTFDTTGGCSNAIRDIYSDQTKYNQAKPVQFIVPSSSVVGNVNDLTVLNNKIDMWKGCIHRDWVKKTEISSQIYDAQQDVKQARRDTASQKQAAEEAKERASALENPYSKTTYWETWFPLGRPMRKENVPVLMGIAIFFLVFALGLFLRLSAIELQFVPIGTNVMRSNTALTNLFSRKST